MKYLSYIINGVLALAIAVLYYFYFAGTVGGVKHSKGQPPDLHNQKGSAIVFINIDTLLNNYDYYFDMRDEFGNKQQELEAELNSKGKIYEQSALDYQNKVQKGLVTRREAAELEQQLLVEQQNLLQLRDELTMQLQEEEQVRNRRLIDKIMEYLKNYNKDYNYQYIFSSSFGSNILFASDSLDITYSVLEGLNKSYNEEKAVKK
jgi:outer membrane protein